MYECGHFAKALEELRRVKDISLSEFAEELDIPKSTLKDVLRDGNTSLHTALHIAEQLDVPLSTLTGEPSFMENLNQLTALLRYFEWFSRLSREDQKTVAEHIYAIMEVLKK